MLQDTFHDNNISNNKRIMLTNKIVIMIVKKAVYNCIGFSIIIAV